MKRSYLLIVSIIVILINITLVCFSQTTNLIFLGGQLGGWWALHGAAMTEIVNRVYPEIVIDFRPGAGVSNIVNVSKKEADLAFTQSIVAREAVLGVESFTEKHPGILAIFSTNPSLIQVVALEKTGITSIKQFIDKKMPVRISVGDRGATSELNNRRLFAEYGITYDDIISWGGKVHYKQMTEANEMMSAGQLDIQFNSGDCPLAVFKELAVNFDLNLLPIDEDVVDSLQEKYGYNKFYITNEQYDFVKEDSLTFGISTIVIAKEDLPEEIVYKITKTIGDNLDYFHNVDENFKKVTQNSLWQNTGIDLHPGAIKYYKEIGVMK